jgi:hypothetical protein
VVKGHKQENKLHTLTAEGKKKRGQQMLTSAFSTTGNAEISNFHNQNDLRNF